MKQPIKSLIDKNFEKDELSNIKVKLSYKAKNSPDFVIYGLSLYC